MLPKPEKTKKLNKNLLGDAEITQESEEVIAAKRLKTKRRLILISLGLTVGLSFVFWTVHQVQQFSQSPKSFNFHPQLSFSFPKFNWGNTSHQTLFSDTDIKNFLQNKNWIISSTFTNNLNQPVFSFNSSNFPLQTEINQLLTIKKTDQSLISLDLPQGLLFQEKIDNENSLSYQNLITLPTNQLFISIKIPDTSSLDQIKSDLSQLTNMLYWYSVSQLSSD